MIFLIILGIILIWIILGYVGFIICIRHDDLSVKEINEGGNIVFLGPISLIIIACFLIKEKLNWAQRLHDFAKGIKKDE